MFNYSKKLIWIVLFLVLFLQSCDDACNCSDYKYLITIGARGYKYKTNAYTKENNCLYFKEGEDSIEACNTEYIITTYNIEQK